MSEGPVAALRRGRCHNDLIDVVRRYVTARKPIVIKSKYSIHREFPRRRTGCALHPTAVQNVVMDLVECREDPRDQG